MRVKVLKIFRDKKTKILHKPNEIIEVSKGRYEEINSTAHGTFLEEIKETKTVKEVKKPTKKAGD